MVEARTSAASRVAATRKPFPIEDHQLVRMFERCAVAGQYTSEATMREKLLYAVRHCSSIDADEVGSTRALFFSTDALLPLFIRP